MLLLLSKPIWSSKICCGLLGKWLKRVEKLKVVSEPWEIIYEMPQNEMMVHLIPSR